MCNWEQKAYYKISSKLILVLSTQIYSMGREDFENITQIK